MARKSLKNVLAMVNEANTEKPVEEMFLRDLCRGIELLADKEQYKAKPFYNPSGIGCPRRMFYQRTGRDGESNTSHMLIGMGETGTARHDSIQRYLSRMNEVGIEIEWIDVAEHIKENNLDYLEVIEQKGMETKLFDTRYNLRFMCDGLIKYKGKLFVFEYKTETTHKFWKRFDTDEKHYNQATCYALSLKVRDVMFVYECRDNCDKKAFLFKVTPEMLYTLKDLIKQSEDCVINGGVPEKNEDHCQYCPYKKICQEDG